MRLAKWLLLVAACISFGYVECAVKKNRASTKNKFVLHCRANAAPRDFYGKISDKDRKDIEYIVTSTGNKPVHELLSEKKSLNHAGDRVNHIHPLKFFMIVFSDEKMKVSMHKLQDRSSVILNPFIDGMGESFDQEAKAGNLKDEYIQEMAATLKVDAKVITPIIRANNWKGLIFKLIEIIPRSGNPNRYN